MFAHFCLLYQREELKVEVKEAGGLDDEEKRKGFFLWEGDGNE